MGRFIIALLLSTGILSTINIVLITSFKSNSFIYLIIFLTNTITFIIITQFYKNTEIKEGNKEEALVISEKSVGIFIRILLYLLPIVGLIGLYLVSVLNSKPELGIEDANSWVSFILGIAAFVMSLVTLWQSEGTYNKIFDALDELRRKTDSIEKTIDITEVLKSNDLGLRSDLTPQIGQQPSSEKGIQNEQESLKQTMNSSPFK